MATSLSILHDDGQNKCRLEWDLGDLDETQRFLFDWWINTAIDDLEGTLPKAKEYGGVSGSTDLELLGDNISKLMGWTSVESEVLQELGCWFYAQGKLARLVSDYQQHRAGKPDTLTDANVYIMMMRRLQAVGRWP